MRNSFYMMGYLDIKKMCLHFSLEKKVQMLKVPWHEYSETKY